MSRLPAATQWDLATRLFHWALVVLVVFSFATGKMGGPWMAWHLKSGYAILALLIFRLAWGFAGSPPARFTSFLRGPRAALAYGARLLKGEYIPYPGHNPLGGWMVVVMLAALLAQAATGLFSNDEVATEGPLASRVSNATVDRMSALHSYNQWLLVVLAAVHIAAVLAYRWKFKVDLVKPMVVGRIGAASSMAIAAILLVASAAAVYWLVVVFARASA